MAHVCLNLNVCSGESGPFNHLFFDKDHIIELSLNLYGTESPKFSEKEHEGPVSTMSPPINQK